MNEISPESLRQQLSFPHSEIRGNGMTELLALQKWLIPDVSQRADIGHDPNLVRLAQSLMTRGDCELFGIPFPRFAFRVYLDKGRTIFANIRRLPALCHQVKLKPSGQWAAFPLTASGQFYPAKDYHNSLVQELLNSSFVADSIVRRFDLSPAVYHVLTCDVAEEMGESLQGENAPPPGTPFSLGLALAGLCASNVCFIVNVLMKRWAKAIYAVGEIATVAHPDYFNQALLPLNEFAPHAMIPYFRDGKVNLNASSQISSDHCGLAEEPATIGKNYLKRCMRPYILSGFPIILQVISQEMQHIYSLNSIPPEAKSAFHDQSDHKLDHAIVVVGCAIDKASDTFIINDPNCLAPLLSSPSSDLFNATCVPYSNGPSEGNEQNNVKQSYPRYISITPRPVRVPFENVDPVTNQPQHDEVNGNNQHLFHSSPLCLLDLIERVQSETPNGNDAPPESTLPRPSAGLAYYTDEFRLLSYGDIQDLDMDDTKSPREGLVLDRPQIRGIRHLHHFLLSRHIHITRDHWFWFQFSRDAENHETFWLWNAQTQIPFNIQFPPSSIWQKVLIAATTKGLNRGGTSDFYINPNAQEQIANSIPREFEQHLEPQDPATLTHRDLTGIVRPSLITSFDMDGIDSALRLDPWHGIRGPVRNVDLYCFMQHDLDNVLIGVKDAYGSTLGNRDSVYQFCASASCDETQIANVAKAIDHLCRKDGDISITGMATYVPDLFADPDVYAANAKSGPSAAETAGRALQFIVSLCAKLRDSFDHNDLKVIELVAGTQIQGIVPIVRWYNPQTILFGALRSKLDEKRYGQLMSSRPVLDLLTHAQTNKMLLALELEPGPLYLLNDEVALAGMAENLARWPDKVTEVLGFNLDVAHWMLAGIKPQSVIDNHEIARRVFHAHVSRHTQAHWCDLGFANDPIARKEIRSWIEMLAQLRQVPGSRFDGIVSLELEAATDIELVRSNFKALASIIRGVY